MCGRKGVTTLRRKITPGDRFRQELIGAVLGSWESFSGYCQLAAQAMLQTAMEVETTEFIGRETYQRREEDQTLYRNDYKRRKVATGEGVIELQIPQTRDGAEPFATMIIEAYEDRLLQARF